MRTKAEITVIGAGLVGSLFALQMSQKGHVVRVFEKRPDMRKNQLDGGRSINLIVTSRGINALRKVGIEKEVLEITVPVTGRMIHNLEGGTTFQPYGRDDSECNYSISRGELNCLLLDLLEKNNIPVKFNSEINSIDLKNQTFSLSDQSEKFEILIGSDGGGSSVRKSLMQTLESEGILYKNEVEYLESEYKEFTMPALQSGEYALEKNALHIWPRGNHMLMALPNQGGSFTMTLYLPTQGDFTFQRLESDDKVLSYFKKFHLSAIQRMPKLLEEWKQNPIGKLATLRAKPWHYQSRVALIGDAAHAIVPFFGQGMNSGFEDCAILDQLYKDYDGDFTQILPKYSEIQVPNGLAIGEMALENYYEMSDHVGDPNFLKKKQLERQLELDFPEHYRSRYGMVVYTLIPYAKAQEAGRIQERALNKILKKGSYDKSDAFSILEEEYLPFLKKNNISVTRFL